MHPREEFNKSIQNHKEYALQWKNRSGGKIVGYLCTYVPEEILYAANALPVRIMRGGDLSISEAHMSPSKWCSWSRGCLSAGLGSGYDHLDGIVVAACCFHYQAAFGSWIKHAGTPFSHYFYMPAHIQGPNARALQVEEMKEFKGLLEKWIGRTVSSADLRKAISIYNENRHLMRRLHELRKVDPPALSGHETMEMIWAGQMMDKAEHNVLLKKRLDFPAGREGLKNGGIRLMAIGSGGNDIDLLSAIESWGADVVIEEHCAGARYFWNDVKPEGDPLESIADRYLERPPCAAKDFPERKRIPFILDLAREYKADGAVILLQSCCEPYSYDIPFIQEALEKEGIPSFVIETDASPDMGRIQNRVEAFLEIIRGRDGEG